MKEYKLASHSYYSLLKPYALENRNNPTEAEMVLWNYIRARRLNGHKFVRQYIIDRFIVDFLCEDDGLIIEVDGAYHTEPKQELSDQQRTEILENLGFKVIRFTNEDILFNIDNVLINILEYLK